jgi:hypothetical protein
VALPQDTHRNPLRAPRPRSSCHDTAVVQSCSGWLFTLSHRKGKSSSAETFVRMSVEKMQNVLHWKSTLKRHYARPDTQTLPRLGKHSTIELQFQPLSFFEMGSLYVVYLRTLILLPLPPAVLGLQAWTTCSPPHYNIYLKEIFVTFECI